MENLILYFYWMQTKKNERESRVAVTTKIKFISLVLYVLLMASMHVPAHIFIKQQWHGIKKWGLGRMRMHKLKLGKMFNKDVHSSPRSVHCMCLCSRFMCTNYKISTCIMCTISVRHLVQMARALLFPSARFVSFSV